MSKTYLEIDGVLSNISYEVENRIKQKLIEDKKQIEEINELGNIVSECSKALTNVLVCMYDTAKQEEEYQGWRLSPTKRYYIRIDTSCLTALISIVVSIINGLQGNSPTVLGSVSGGATIISAYHALKQGFKHLREDNFCILLMAHQMNSGKKEKYVSPHGLYSRICAEGCPFSMEFERVYGKPCPHLEQSGRCNITEKEIQNELQAMGNEYGIKQIGETDLFQIT